MFLNVRRLPELPGRQVDANRETHGIADIGRR
jgi:hypothetical protein